MNTLAPNPIALIAQADLVLLVADLLRSPLHRQFAAEIGDGDLAALLDTSALGQSGELRDSLLLLAEEIRRTDREQWSDEYHRLFEGSMACPANESTYVRRDKGAIIADVLGFYRAFGFQHRPETGEKPDHIRGELEFFAMLLVAMAQAIADDNTEAAEVTATALGRFAEAHLAEWLPSFAFRLASVSRAEVFCALAAALHVLWHALVRFHGVNVQPLDAAEPIPEPDDPCECAMLGPAQSDVEFRISGRSMESLQRPTREL